MHPLLFLFVLATMLCASHSADDIIIGRTVSLVGVYELEGRAVKNGIDFAYEWFNRERNGTITLAGGEQHKLVLKTYDDGSSDKTASFYYRTMTDEVSSPRVLKHPAVDAVLGPWTTQISLPAMAETNNTNTTFVFSGASAPSLYNVAYTHSIGTLVQASKRSATCMRLFAQKGVRSAFIVSTDDSFQQTSSGIIRGQLAALNVTVQSNMTVLRSSVLFPDVIEAVLKARPELLVLAMETTTCAAFVLQLRTESTAWQPQVVFVTNAATVAAVYELIGWAADGIYAGNQWSPLLLYNDTTFGSSARYSELYRTRFNYTPSFLDAAASTAFLLLVDGLERAGTTEGAVLQAALRATNQPETFFGPIRFLPTGELDQGGVCEQMLRIPGAPVDSLERQMRAVAPANLAIDVAIYPSIPVRPPVDRRWIRYSDPAGYVFIILGCLFIPVSIAVGIFVAYSYGREVILTLGYWYNNVLLLGFILSAMLPFTLIGEPTESLCMSQPWIGNIAFALILSVPLIKAIGSSRVFESSNRGTVFDRESNNKLVFITLGMLAVEFVIMGIWTGVAPVKVSAHKETGRDGRDVFYVNCVYRGASLGFLLGNLAWKLMALLVVVIVAVRTHHKNKMYKEGRRIAVMIYNTFIAMVVAVALVAGLSTVDGNSLYYLKLIFICLFAEYIPWSNTSMFFGPLILDRLDSSTPVLRKTGQPTVSARSVHVDDINNSSSEL